MESSKNIIDAGQDTVHFHFKVPTKGLSPGETTLTHLPADQILTSMKLANMDLFNPHAISLSVDAPPHVHVGASLAHGETGQIPLATHNRAVVIDHENERAEGYHSVSTGARVAPVHKLLLTPSEEQLAENSGLVLKKIDHKWAGLGPKNATAGAFKAEIDGKDKILVAPEGTDGSASAVHRFLVHNETNSKLFGGRYTKNNVKTTYAPNGKQAFIMDPADFKEARDSLKKSLTTTSPFKHGLTAALTNLSSQKIESPTPTFVNVQIHRTPVDKASGIMTREHTVVEQKDVHALTGSKTSAAEIPKYNTAVEIREDDAISGGDNVVEITDKNVA